MKKVTLTFWVSDNVVDMVKNDVAWGNMVNVAQILDENCEYSSFDAEDYHEV